ncbi:MAG TPA: radical SAM/SPASM domain-containing protein [Pseudomonadales bacterium]|nr:radical SAM/SPASM domain-containing protein [Pseudomonadales bacterium]
MITKTAQPQFTAQKRETVESFLRFAQGEEFPRWPLEVFLEVSNICDLQCAMCPTFSALNTDRFFALKREDRGVIAYDTATEPLDEVLQHALIIHASGYGEPTIHPQYKELLAYLSRYEALIDFFTNGMHLDDELCQFLVQGHIHRISISFSGVTAEEYENIYIGGDYERVLGGIRRLAKAKQEAGTQYPRIEVNSIAFKHHIDTLPDFVRLMGEAGANVIHVKPLRVFEKTIAELKHHESHMHPDKEEKILLQAKAVARELGVNLASAPYEATQKHALNYTRAFEAMPDAERESLFERVLAEKVAVADIKGIALSAAKRQEKKEALGKERNTKERTQFEVNDNNFVAFNGAPCLEPFRTLHASFDGRVRTCCFTGAKDWIGHLDQNTAEEIWHGPVYKKIREQAARGKYQRKMCDICLKKGAYPKNHYFQAAFNGYSKWYQAIYGEPFLPDLLAGVQTVPAGEAIMQLHARRCEIHGDPDCPLC